MAARVPAREFIVWAETLDESVVEVTVQVAIVETDGTRVSHVVRLPPIADDVLRVRAVPDSDDPARHRTCVIEAIELDEQLVRTGR